MPQKRQRPGMLSNGPQEKAAAHLGHFKTWFRGTDGAFWVTLLSFRTVCIDSPRASYDLRNPKQVELWLSFVALQMPRGQYVEGMNQ